MKLVEPILSFQAEIEAIRRDLHAHPELSWREDRTSDAVVAALQDGRLRRVLAGWSPTVPGLFLYYASRRHMRPALRAFIDCLLDRDLEDGASGTAPG